MIIEGLDLYKEDFTRTILNVNPSCIVRPLVHANNFEIKPNMIQMFQ